MGLRCALSVSVALGVLLPLKSAHAAGPTWPERFARERPRMIRAIEGLPAPPGYEFENHYDGRRLAMGGLSLAVAELLQLVTISTYGIEGLELIPCAGFFLGDYGEKSGSGYVDFKDTGRALVAVPTCALFALGGVEIGRGLADVRPVWVRSKAEAPSLVLTGAIADKEATIRAIGRF
jgi:hypothetical protein